MIFAQDLFNAGYLQFQLVFEERYDGSTIQEEFFGQEIKFIEVDTAENQIPGFDIENTFSVFFFRKMYSN